MKKVTLAMIFGLMLTTLAYGYQTYHHGGGHYYDDGYYGRDRDRGRDYDRGRGRDGYGHRYDDRYDRGYNSGYTAEDRAKVDAIYQKYDAQMSKLGSDMFAKKNEIRVEMNQENPNQSKIESLMDERAKISAEIQKLRVKIDSEIRTALKK